MRLFCLHGFTGTPEMWVPVLERLHGVEAWCPALLGHGEIELSDPATFRQEVDRLAGALRARGAAPYHLLAYSMGARVGLGLLVQHPELFASATLVGVHPGLDDQAARRSRKALDEERARELEQRGVEAFIDRWEQLPLFASQRRLPPEVLAHQRAGRLGHRPKGLARALRVLGPAGMPSYREHLPSLDLPVQLVVGGEDLKFLRLAKEMVERLPRGMLVQVPGVGHNVVLEAPQAVADAVMQLVPDVASKTIGRTLTTAGDRSG